MAGQNVKRWVLLAAGSTGWDNYRHQADVCHAYQIARRSGIPDQQIVVMMYDDIAYNPQNPTQGVIINSPNGPNVYAGVPRDYTNTEVTAEMFRAVLKGDRSVANKKVIQCVNGDIIFIYISDHGSSGLFCFPNSTLYASDLVQDLTQLAQNNPSSVIVVFVESCYSGSMLYALPSNVTVYGISASSPNQSSYACFYDKERQAYLADEFSALWMYYTENCDPFRNTFADEFQWVKTNMNQSTPCQYGNVTLSQMVISTVLDRRTERGLQREKVPKLSVFDLIPNHEVPLALLKKKIEAESDNTKKEELRKELEDLEKVHKDIDSVAEKIEERCREAGADSVAEKIGGLHCGAGAGKPDKVLLTETHLQDLKTVHEHFRSTCFDWHDERFVYALSKLSIFAEHITFGLEATRIIEAINEASTKWNKS